MNILNELIDGTRPSNELTLTLDVVKFDVIFTLHELKFKSVHASRALFEQLQTGNVIIKRSNGDLVAAVHSGDWKDTIYFRVVACSVIRE